MRSIHAQKVTFVLGGYMTHTDWYIHVDTQICIRNVHMLKGCNNITQGLGDVTYKGYMQN